MLAGWCRLPLQVCVIPRLTVFVFPQESLGGNTRTSLVVAVADAIEHCDETLQSLQFGTRAMFVENMVGSCAESANI